jgi:hypothetical protein
VKRIFLIPILMSFVFSFAEARELHEFYNGVRCLGMGGACIAVVNDETALLVNPAALGKLRDYYGTILDPEIESSSNSYRLYQENKFTAPMSLDNVKPSLDADRETNYHAKAQVFPSFVARNFGIGFLGNYTLDAKESADGTTLDTFYRNDMAFILGYSLRFFDGRVKIGFNAKLINRIEVNNSTLSATGPLDYKSIASEGTGLSTDVGLILSAPWTYLPTISAVVHDVGGTSFDKANGVRMTTATQPQSVAQDMDVAVALFPIHSNYVRSSWTLEYEGVLSASQEADKAKRIHAGLELNFGDMFFVRGGYNQRYWTAGLEFASERFQFQLASYGEEIGDNITPIEDRRYVVKTAWRF